MASTKTTSPKAKKRTPRTSAKAKKQAPTLSTRALMHGQSAYGSRFVKPGFAFTPEDDLAFALGYPHLVYLADGHPDDQDPEKAAPAFVKKHGLGASVWPREVAHRVVRAFGWWHVPDKLEEAYRSSGPVTEEEAVAIIRDGVHTQLGQYLLLLLEAMFGPAIVCETLAERLEVFTNDDWTDSPVADTMLPSLGYLLLRLQAEQHGPVIARLEALREKSSKASNHFQRSAARALDVVLHGAEGAERSAQRIEGAINTYSRLHVLDDPGWILRAVRACGPPEPGCEPDPRLVFLGGREVLDLELSWWKGYRSHALLVERLGKIKSAKILPWMLEMSATSKAKRSAQTWFIEHADYAVDFLEQTAKEGGSPADWATALLKKLG